MDLVGGEGLKCRKCTTEGEEGRRRRDRRTPKPFTPISSSGAYVPVRTGPASCSNSNSTHSQTEINRILRYAELSIKIFAQTIAAWPR